MRRFQPASQAHRCRRLPLLPPLQREDYGATQADWYLLRFDHCDRCSLSGSGTIDGRAWKWIRGAAGGGELPSGGAGAAEVGVAGDAPRAARNWQDASCADPQLCRPRLLGVLDSGDVTISGVRVTGAPAGRGRGAVCMRAWAS